MTTEEIKTIKQQIEGLENKFNDFKQSLDTYHEKASQKIVADAIAHTEIRSELRNLNLALIEILEQTTKTNGRVTRSERNILIAGVVLVTLLVVNGSKLLAIIGILI